MWAAAFQAIEWVGRVAIEAIIQPQSLSCMSIWIAEGFDSRKVLKYSLCLLAEERLTYMEYVSVAMHEQGRFLVAFHFIRQSIQDFCG